jgi:hypothetical protein
MKLALVIFNGIQFHHYHAQSAIQWAMQNEGSLHGLFVHSDKEPREGYIFPSDIDPAENLYNKSDAAKNNVKIIVNQIKLFTDMARAKNIPVITEELLNPPLKKILGITNTASILLIDADYNKAALLACTSFKLEDLIEDSKCPVELVVEKSK